MRLGTRGVVSALHLIQLLVPTTRVGAPSPLSKRRRRGTESLNDFPEVRHLLKELVKERDVRTTEKSTKTPSQAQSNNADGFGEVRLTHHQRRPLRVHSSVTF